MSETTNEKLSRTPLYDLHRELGAKIVPFAGYEMPVQYPTGIIKEHVHTRTQAGLFDVSHMGQVHLRGPKAVSAFEKLVPLDVQGLRPQQQHLNVFTNEQGGIIDDLMVANYVDHLYVVVNAACKKNDIAHMHRHLDGVCQVKEITDRALLALQGPKAAEVLARLAPETSKLFFMTGAWVKLMGVSCQVSRSGYTGEDGFEIAVPEAEAMKLARKLLSFPEVAPIGLGARDSLRLESGMCLYGHDIDTTTSPVEANLLWLLSKSRRADGARPGGYLGAEVVLKHLKEGVKRKRVGLRAQARVPVRDGAELKDAGGKVVGKVTSGSFGPTVGAPVAQGYVPTGLDTPGSRLTAQVRSNVVPMEVVKMPFVPTHYHRG
jgi:aminomethyltransferase